jgi:hypothetical protein
MSQFRIGTLARGAIGEIMARPRKMEQYIAEGRRLVALVDAHRAAKAAEASLQSGSPEPDQAPVPTKRKKSYPLPPLETPTPIPGFPFRDPAEQAEAPDYGTIGRMQAIRAAQAERRGKKAPMKPIGPSELRKRHDVRAWKVAE